MTFSYSVRQSTHVLVPVSTREITDKNIIGVRTINGSGVRKQMNCCLLTTMTFGKIRLTTGDVIRLWFPYRVQFRTLFNNRFTYYCGKTDDDKF